MSLSYAKICKYYRHKTIHLFLMFECLMNEQLHLTKAMRINNSNNKVIQNHQYILYTGRTFLHSPKKVIVTAAIISSERDLHDLHI